MSPMGPSRVKGILTKDCGLASEHRDIVISHYSLATALQVDFDILNCREIPAID